MLFVLRLAPFCLAFSTKMHCILHQNALHLAAYCTAFSSKLQYIQPQIAPKLVQTAAFWNINSLCLHLQLPPFRIKTNLRENRSFAARLAIGGRKGTHNVKSFAKNQTKPLCGNTRKWSKARKTCRLATTSSSGCRARCSRATGTAFHGKAEVICHRQAVFGLWRPHGIISARLLFETQPCFTKDKWGKISDFIVSQSGTSYMSGGILVLQYKDINASQFIEIPKVKTTSFTRLSCYASPEHKPQMLNTPLPPASCCAFCKRQRDILVDQ